LSNKEVLYYEVATYAGLFGMQIQGATAIFAVNLKRIITFEGIEVNNIKRKGKISLNF